MECFGGRIGRDARGEEVITLTTFEESELRRKLKESTAEIAILRAAIEDHKSGSTQLAKWLEESRVEAMAEKRLAASARASMRILGTDLQTCRVEVAELRGKLSDLLTHHRKYGITALFLALEELIQETK
jgi:predicted RNase H-like nuclease (RuvC/YqgF family)